MMKLSVFMMLFTFLLNAFFFGDKWVRSEEHVIIYPAYGYYEDEEWVIPVRLYSYEYRNRTERIANNLINIRRDLTSEQSELFEERIRYFVADSESGEEIELVFEGDPDETVFRVQDEDGHYPTTNLNGVIEGEIRISAEQAEMFLEYQDSDDQWLTVHVVSEGHTGSGKIRLIPPNGLSVISDIDDTIKITQIPAGSRVVVRNTFYKEYSTTPRMAELYNQWERAAFHYVSGSPWQLYPVLSEFMFDESIDYPEGTFHLKSTPKNLFSRSTWSDLREVVLNDDVTYEQKLRQIAGIFEHFPEREFIMVGDSGERDPEIFSEVRNLYPDQVREIIIRDVVNARELTPERLKDMRIIPAPTIFRRGEMPLD